MPKKLRPPFPKEFSRRCTTAIDPQTGQVYGEAHLQIARGQGRIDLLGGLPDSRSRWLGQNGQARQDSGGIRGLTFTGAQEANKP